MLQTYGAQMSASKASVPWKHCRICKDEDFKSPRDFTSHLRMVHCRKEGGSYICSYGQNSLCKNLPLEGVCDKDYETHVNRYHVAPRAEQIYDVEVNSNICSSGDNINSKNEMIMTEKQKVNPGDNSGVRLWSQHSQSEVPNSHVDHTASRDRGADYIHNSVASNSESAALEHVHSDNITTKDGVATKGGQRGRHHRKERRWTVLHAKVNMAALLNDPRPGKRQPDFFTKTWGVGWDYLDLTPIHFIPEILPEHFKKYQDTVIPRLRKHKKTQAVSVDVNVPIDAFPPLYTRTHDKASADVGKVPAIFHSSNFNLSDVDIFHLVFPWGDLETSRNRSQKLHQEKLSHYLDIVEVQIARQVALKSEAFFHVMSSHKDLQSRLSDSTKSIVTLRGKMRNLNSSLVENPLMVLVKTRRRQRLQLITRKMKLMSTLHQTQPTVQQLLSSSDYVGALDIISTAQEVLSKELTGIQSFRHLGSQLSELEKAINIMVGQEFQAFITKDLNRPLSENEELIDEDIFTAVFMGLLRQNSTDFIGLYRNEIAATVKAIVKQTVIGYVSAADTFGSENSTLAGQMRHLNFNTWLLLMEDVFSNLLIIIQRVKTIGDLMRLLSREAAGLDTLSGDGGDQEEDRSHSLVSGLSAGQSIITEMFADRICKELRDLLIKACEQANERCSKVISARSKDMYIEKLSSREFFSLMSSVERFAKTCDLICGSKISTNSVRGCLQGYNIRFVNKFHEERKNKLNLLLDNERWRQVDIPRDLQALLTHCELCEQLTMSDDITDADSGPDLQYIIINDQRFVIVGTVITLLKMILEYCTCLEDLPKSAPDILTKLIEIFKLFNSRSSQLVLGAGALQLVGLKTISAKNLALLQRSLELLLHYLPIIRNQFTIYLVEPKTAMLRHLDTVIADYRQHVKIVQEKLKELASGMIESCINQWVIRPPMPSLCFRTLCKQIKRYHEAVCDIIEHVQLQQLFREVNTLLRVKLKARLSELNITILTGPQQGLIMSDIAYFKENSTLQSGQSKKTVTLTLAINDIIISR